MRSRLFLAFAATTVAACSSPTGGGGDPDASVTPSDVPAADVPAVTDTPAATDVPRDAPRDVATGPTCNGAPIENVETLGMRSGATLRYSGDNNSASNSTTRGIQSGTTTAPCNFRTQFQRVFIYTLRGNASLRVSTSNPGTSEDFDTTLVLYNGRTCPTSFRTLYCNDDDPGAAMSANRFTSRIITQGFAMGDTVLIGVGGYAVPTGQMASGEPQGNFELSIEELPLIADGAACRRDGTTGACGISSTCVAENILADAGTCRANGSVPGARCSMTTCGMGLECDTDRDLCFRRMPDGMPCDRFTDGWARCGATSNCVAAGNGNVSGTCRAFGSAANTECAAGNMCAMGLTCRSAATTPTCGRPADMDGRCNATDSVCPTGQSCVSDDPAVFQGRCFEPGAALGAPCTGTCGQGLTCNTAATTPTCVRAVMTGERCSAREPCPTGNTCYLTNLVDRYHGTCFAPGVIGGPCRGTGTACDMGVCSNTETPASGRCLREVAMGGACELVGPTRCATGTTCVRNAGSTTAGTCREAGTVAGAACRAMGTRCDGMLVCSAMTGAGICQEPSTATCDPRYNTRACPMNQTCRATSFEAGGCAAPSAMETEPNQGTDSAQAMTGAAGTVRGALGRFDTDCFTVDVPANGRVFARVAAPTGFCYTGTAVLALDLYNPDGRWLGSNTNSGPFGCPMIDGPDSAGSRVFPWAAGLAAGRHTLCVRNPDAARAAVPDYVLDWSVSAP